MYCINDSAAVTLNFSCVYNFISITKIFTILLTKTAAAQNEAALSYHKVRGLYFLAVFVRSISIVNVHNFLWGKGFFSIFKQAAPFIIKPNIIWFNFGQKPVFTV